LTQDIQPILADMLNKCFFTSKLIVFKIAAIKFRTRLYIPRKNIGLELGSDIFADIDLDSSQMWERGLDTSIRFFTEVLKKHLNFSISNLGLGLKMFTKSNIMQLFASEKTFIELVKASEGVPRDFLNVFRRAYNYFWNDPKAKRIFIRHVKKAVADWYQEDKISDLNASSKIYNLLERLINEVIIRYRTKQFILLSSESANRELQQLIDMRLLHLLKQGWSSKGTPGKRFDVFSIDYGAFISILATKVGKEVQQLWSGDKRLPEVSLRDIRRKEFNIVKSTPGIKQKNIWKGQQTSQEQLVLFKV